FDVSAALDSGAAYLFDGGTGALLQTFPNPAQGAFDHFGFAVAAGPSLLLVGTHGPSLAYVYRPAVPASAAPRAETIEPAVSGPQCGYGTVPPGDECRCCRAAPPQQGRFGANCPC